MVRRDRKSICTAGICPYGNTFSRGELRLCTNQVIKGIMMLIHIKIGEIQGALYRCMQEESNGFIQ